MTGSEIDVPERSRKFLYYAGGICLSLVLLQVITGALLSIYYKPSAEDAYASIQYINNRVEFGAFIRSLHFWSANALVLTSVVFVLMVFYTKSFRKPFRKMWYLLIASFLVLMVFAFTGQTLPWMEFSYFGAVIGISQLGRFPIAGTFIAEILKGGGFFGGETLSRMYAIHTNLLPALLFFILAACFYHVRHNKAAASAGEPEPPRKGNSYSLKIVISALTGVAIIAAVSVLLPKGLGKPYDINNPSGAPGGIHPDWYFMWIYQTLKGDLFLPEFVLQLFIFFIVVFWFAAPALEDKFSTGRNNSAVKSIGAISIIYILAMTFWGYVDSGISPLETSYPGNIATGGIDRFSFLGIILFTIVVMIALLYLRIKSVSNLKDGNY